MKIIINAPIMGDKIINLLTGYKEDGIEFRFVKKTGMKLEFEVDKLDAQSAANLAKTLIRNTEFGKVLYFSIDAV